MMPVSDANPSNRKRNVYLAVALTLIAMSFLFAPGEGGMLWMMWRDAPWLAVPLMILAAVFLVLWRRASRS